MKVIAVVSLLMAIAVVRANPANPSAEAANPETPKPVEVEASARSARFDERKFGNTNKLSGAPSNDLELHKKQQVSQFLTSKNVIRTLVKLIFGNDEESAATSKQILNIFVSVLDMLKNTLGQKARSGGARGTKAVLSDAATASVSLLKGFVRAYMTNNNTCVQKYLCEASKEAVSDGQEIGYLVAQIGGYAASYALDHQKPAAFQENYTATRKGRSGEDCKVLYHVCNDVE